MRKEDSISVRLDNDVRKRLDKVADHVNLDKTALIRMAVEAMLDQVEKKNWKLILPIAYEKRSIKVAPSKRGKWPKNAK